MRAGTRWTVVGFMILCMCACAYAQNQDRDSRGAPGTSASAPPPQERVDLNHASVGELLKVPGMTQTWAARIVRYRPYHSKTDLLQRGVVPDAVYERIKDFVIAHREKQ